MDRNRACAVALVVVCFFSPTETLRAQSGIVTNNSVTTSLASATATVPAGTGAVINDCLAETFTTNPIPPNGASVNGPYFTVRLCKGTWVAQMPIVLDAADEVTGAGKPSKTATSNGTLIRADPNNFPAALPAPAAVTGSDGGAGTSGITAGTYYAEVTYISSLQSVGNPSGTFTVSALSCSSNTVTLTTSSNHNYLVGQPVTIIGNVPSGYNGVYSVSSPTANTFQYSVSSCPGTATTLGSVTGSLTIRETLPSPLSASFTVTTTGDSISITLPTAQPGGSCLTGCGSTYHTLGLPALGTSIYISAVNQSAPIAVFRRVPSSCTGGALITTGSPATAVGCSIGSTAAVFSSGGPFANSGTPPPLVNESSPVIVLGSQSIGDNSSRFGVRLEDLGIDCSAIAGIGVMDAGAQERSGLFSVDVLNTTGTTSVYANATTGGGCLQADLYWRGPGAQNSSIVSASVGSGGGSGSFTNYSPYIPIVMDGRNGGTARQIRDTTITPTSVTNNQWVVSEGIYLTGQYNSAMDLSLIHCEAMEACVTVDNNSRPVIQAISGASTIGGAVTHITSSAGPVELHDIRAGGTTTSTLQDDNVGLVTLTSSSVPVSLNQISRTTNVVKVTVTGTPFSIPVGTLITVSGVTVGAANYNGRFVVCNHSLSNCGDPTSSQFQYAEVAADDSTPHTLNAGAAITYASQNSQDIPLYSISLSGASITNRSRVTSLSNVSSVASLNNIGNQSASPLTIDVSTGDTIEMTLTGNITSSMLVNAAAGQRFSVTICQDSTGSRTFTWPSNVKGAMTIGPTASKCNTQTFVYDGTNAYADSPGQTNE